MKLAVRVNGVNGLIVGYCPDKSGTPKAIVLMEGALRHVALADLELLNVPHRLRKISDLSGKSLKLNGARRADG